MAKTDIGPKIGIDGEREFRRQIGQINTDLKTLASETKLVTSAFAGNEQSTEALTEKNAVLSNSLDKLNEKLRLQSQELAKLQSAYGEQDKRTQAAYQAYNKTKTQINEVTAAINKNAQQMQYNDSILGKLGVNIESVGQKLGLSTTATNKLTAAFGEGAAEAAVFVAVVVKLASELVKLSDAATKHGDEVSTLATKYNMTSQTVQKLQYMAELTDTSFETVSGSLSKLTRNMNSARDGTGAAAEAFAALGVSVTNSDGSLRSANDVFAEAIDALGNVGNETERDALAMQIFGKSAMELNPLIAQGSENLKALADEAANSGYVMSDKMISVLQRGDDATQRLDKSMEGLKNTIGAGATPIVAGWKMILAEAADNMAVFIQKLAGMREEADDTTGAINGTTEAVQGLNAVTDTMRRNLMSDDAKEYIRYLNSMSDYYKSMGIENGSIGGFVMTGDEWTAYNRSAREGTLGGSVSQTIDVTLQIDGQTLARTTYDQFQAEGSRRGSQAYN